MSKQYPGGFIIKNPTTPTTSAAPGMWTLEQASYYIKQGTWPLPATIDPYFKYVTTLLHGDGTNAAQNNTFIDSSTNAYSVTRNGSTTQGTFTPFGTNWSNYVDVKTSRIEIVNSNSSMIAQGTEFTLESWVFLTTPGTGNLYNTGVPFVCSSPSSAGTGNGRLYMFGSTTFGFWDRASATWLTISWTPTIGQWFHFALVSTGTVFTLYINGTSVGSVTDTSSYYADSTWNFYIGSTSGAANGSYVGPNMFVSNFRYTKAQVYTTNFTPSTTPLTAIANTTVLTCQSNTFKDNSTNGYTVRPLGTPAAKVVRSNPFTPSAAYSTSVVGGSMYFNGSTDYLTVPLAAYAFGTGAFTLEAWVYIQSVAAFNEVFYGSVSGGALDELQFGVQTGQTIGWETNNSISGSGGFVPLNAWTHIALVRNGSTITGYVNGTSVGTSTDGGDITPTTHSLIGSYRGSSSFTNGFVSNARVTKAAVYTGNFTPSTAPLPAIANTSLLMLGTNAGIYDNAMMADWVTVGNAQISTSVKKYGTGSMSFDGTDDRLTSVANPAFAFGTGDFTVEAWINTNILTGEKGFIQTSTTAGGLQTSYTDGVIAVIVAGAGSYTITANVGGTNVTGSIAITTGTWYHVAFTRASGSVRLFINGTLAGGPTTITANLTGQNMVVGGYYSTGYLWNGYVDDLRITNGVARYTASFTPPTSAFPDQ